MKITRDIFLHITASCTEKHTETVCHCFGVFFCARETACGLQRDDIGSRHEWVPPTGGGRMDDLRHFPHAHRDDREFGRNDSALGPRDGGDEENGRTRGSASGQYK